MLTIEQRDDFYFDSICRLSEELSAVSEPYQKETSKLYHKVVQAESEPRRMPTAQARYNAHIGMLEKLRTDSGIPRRIDRLRARWAREVDRVEA